MERSRERGTAKDTGRRRLKRAAERKPRKRESGRLVCFNKRLGLPLPLKRLQITLVAISEIHLASDWMSTDVFITLLLIICLIQHSLPFYSANLD